MSLGHAGFGSTENSAFADLFSSNILIVAAAGNAGNTDLVYPASYDSVVSVAAVDSNKNVAYFSHRNAHVEIAAPGVRVLSTVPMGTGYVQRNYAYKSGTSMATPHVSGVAALIWSHDATKTASEVRAALQGGAQDLGDNGRDNSTGYGLVQAAAACATLTGSSCTPEPSLGPSLRPSPGPTSRPTLSSSDPSGSPSKEPSLAPSVSSYPSGGSPSEQPSLAPSASSHSSLSLEPYVGPPSFSSSPPIGSPSEKPSFAPFRFFFRPFRFLFHPF
jgi:serine protease